MQPGRLRLRGRALAHPCLDLAYLQALLEALPAVESARINHKARSLIIHFDGGARTRQHLLKLLADLPLNAYRPDAVREQAPDPFRVVVSALLAVATPLLPLPARRLVSWALALPTLGKGIDTLVSDGVRIEVLDASARLLSLLRGDYFTANAIGALLDLGEYVEATSEQRSTDLLKRLLTPQTETVWIERTGIETKVTLAEVAPGDILICGPGELIPIDGRVHSGEAAVNQASLTGESLPVPVAPGSPVLSGSVIHEGHLRIRVEQIGAETSMARINRFLETALRTRSTGETRSTQLDDRLVPLTILTGLGVFALTRDLSRASSVLTVDYSCAIKLSNPVAVRANIFAASRAGGAVQGRPGAREPGSGRYGGVRQDWHPDHRRDAGRRPDPLPRARRAGFARARRWGGGALRASGGARRGRRSVATKLWGELDGQQVQFANARKDHPFRVIAILGGEAAQAQIASLGIREGRRLSLQTVCPDEVVGEPIPAQIVVTSADGLRLYLRPDQAQLILVETRPAAT